jgi:hypothetical protein
MAANECLAARHSRLLALRKLSAAVFFGAMLVIRISQMSKAVKGHGQDEGLLLSTSGFKF